MEEGITGVEAERAELFPVRVYEIRPDRRLLLGYLPFNRYLVTRVVPA